MVDSLEELKEPCIKLTVFHPTDAEGVTAKTFVPKWEDRLQLACSGFTYVDVMNKGTNKGNSLKMIQDYYGISPEETMTFGDNTMTYRCLKTLITAMRWEMPDRKSSTVHVLRHRQ